MFRNSSPFVTNVDVALEDLLSCLHTGIFCNELKVSWNNCMIIVCGLPGWKITLTTQLTFASRYNWSWCFIIVTKSLPNPSFIHSSGVRINLFILVSSLSENARELSNLIADVKGPYNPSSCWSTLHESSRNTPPCKYSVREVCLHPCMSLHAICMFHC